MTPLVPKVMTPKIIEIELKRLVGMHLTMSLANNRTGELWRKLMPRRNEITDPLTADLYSLQVYSSTHFSNFQLTNEFEKWALMEVANFDHLPEGMETFLLPGGLYAVFDYQGLSNDPTVFQYIFTNWLPNSDYLLDTRPHFEILGEKYKNNDPASEEQIWIPIKSK